MASELLRIGISFVFYHRTSVFSVFPMHMSEYWQSGVLSSSFKCNFDTWILWCFRSSQRSRAFSRCSLYSWLQTNQIQVSKLHVKTRVNLHLIPNSHVNYTWIFCNYEYCHPYRRYGYYLRLAASRASALRSYVQINSPGHDWSFIMIPTYLCKWMCLLCVQKYILLQLNKSLRLIFIYS